MRCSEGRNVAIDIGKLATVAVSEGDSRSLGLQPAITARNYWTKVKAPPKFPRGLRFDDYALTTLPLRKQEVQTRMCLLAAPTLA